MRAELNEDYDDDLIIDESDEDQYDDEDSISGEASGESNADDEVIEQAKKPTRAEKRINELTWKAKSAEERALAAEQANAELARRLEAIEQAKSTETLSSLKAKKIEALETGDYELVAEIDEQLIEARYGAKKQPENAPEQQQSPQQPQKPDAWVDWEFRNQDVLNDPEKLNTANKIMAALHKNGIDVKEARFWSLLDKNLNRPAKPQSQAGNGVGGNDSGNHPTQGLTRADMEHIKELGYDYKDKQVQAAYLKSKRSAANGSR